MTELIEYHDDVFMLRHVLSHEECDRYIERARAEGFADAPITTARGPVMDQSVRNNTRVMFDDVREASRLWARVEGALPERWRRTGSRRYGRGGDHVAVGLNERLRFYKYTEGQYFAPHRDGCFRRGRDEFSMLTVLFFLNEGFLGGETVILEPECVRAVTPERGSALFFFHPMFHEGAVLREGVKFILRSDVMYRRDDHGGT